MKEYYFFIKLLTKKQLKIDVSSSEFQLIFDKNLSYSLKALTTYHVKIYFFKNKINPKIEIINSDIAKKTKIPSLAFLPKKSKK